tara:strand:- start:513 stop:1151 length:639 start_codon:yes stop_codon:yes gene_type:complete
MILKDYIKTNPNFLVTVKTKICLDCNKRKSIFLYDYRNDTNKLKNQCHRCVVIKKIQWKKNNREKVLKGSKERYIKYKKQICYRMSSEYYIKNKMFDVLNRKNERGKKHYQDNKYYYAVKTAKQRALKLKQTFPQGVECKEILLLYKKRNALNKRYGKNKYSVDHIIPLKNKYVCGLHNIKNLRILLTKENLKKSNKFIPGHNEDFYNKKFW